MKSMLDVERLEMANEDKRSLEVELFRQKEHFKQRNDVPPQIPSVMMDLGTEDSEGGPLTYRPLVASIKPEEPTVDNYQRFQMKVKLPDKIDLSKVKVLWSKEKETAEQEQQRLAELARRKEENEQRLQGLMNFNNQSAQKPPSSYFKKPSNAQQLTQACSSIEQVCRLKLPSE